MAAASLSIFISHSHKDEVVRNFIIQELQNHGIKCGYDKYLPPSREFNRELPKMIRASDILLLLLTKSSMSSPAVHQEIGCALGLGKPIWPLSIEKDVKPEGLIPTLQIDAQVNWQDPKIAILQLAERLKAYKPKEAKYENNFESSNEGDQLSEPPIMGKRKRTRTIINLLKQQMLKSESPMVLYNQSAFSIFSASENIDYMHAGNHSEEYRNLLLKEKEAVTSLVRDYGATLKLLLWPVRYYNRVYQDLRFTALIEWMEANIQNSRIKYVLGEYPGLNRYLVENVFCLEGYKAALDKGYALSLLYYDKIQIAKCIGAFNGIFDKFYCDKQLTIEKIKGLAKANKERIEDEKAVS